MSKETETTASAETSAQIVTPPSVVRSSMESDSLPPGEEYVAEPTADIVEDTEDTEEENDTELAAGSVPSDGEYGDNKPKKHWYVVKVQSGREDTIREAILRKVRKEGLEDCFGQIYIPVEKISEVKVDKNGKKVTRTRERRLYAGYLFVEAEYNDRILYLFRDTSGVGGFVGEHPGHPERPPTPMTEREIQRMLGSAVGAADVAKSEVPPPPKLSPGDHVRVIDGPFNGMDATVKAIQPDTAKILAEVTIFGRPVEVDFEYYQVEH